MVSTRRQALTGLATSLLLPAWAQQVPQVEDKSVAPPQEGSRLALPELTLLDGTRFRPADADADGHILVLYWWASWCPFCAQQSLLMDKFWLTHKTRGLLMLGLSIDRRPEGASAYLSQRGYTFPAGLVTPTVAQVLPKPKGLPVTVVRGRDDRVLAAETWQLFPEDIEQFARFLLSERCRWLPATPVGARLHRSPALSRRSSNAEVARSIAGPPTLSGR